MTLSTTTQLELHRMMMLIRLFEEALEEMFSRGLLHGTMHLSIGQEATAAGACLALQKDDLITSTHRGHGHCLAKGAEPYKMFAELLVAYPMKVQTKQGMRILHANDPNAKANKKAKDRYRRVVGNKRFIHDKILKLLDKQLKIERGRLEYLQNLEVWINNHTWEKYSNIESDGGSSEENRITRRL